MPADVLLSERVQETLLALHPQTSIPLSGWAWSEPEAAWRRVIGQIRSVGSSRSWDALDVPEVWEALSVPRIRAEGDKAPAYVHRLLANLRVRYCSPEKEHSTKGDAVAENALSEFVANGSGYVHLLEKLRDAVGEPAQTGLFSHRQAAAARRMLVDNLRFFGPKSASDFLLGLGLADSLIAFDIRLLNLLTDHLGWDLICRRHAASLHNYERLEAEVTGVLCGPLGITPLLLDRLLFQHYSILRREWSQKNP